MKFKYIGKSVDGIIKPKNAYEEWSFWMNRIQTQLLQMHISSKRKIEVNYDTN